MWRKSNFTYLSLPSYVVGFPFLQVVVFSFLAYQCYPPCKRCILVVLVLVWRTVGLATSFLFFSQCIVAPHSYLVASFRAFSINSIPRCFFQFPCKTLQCPCSAAPNHLKASLTVTLTSSYVKPRIGMRTICSCLIQNIRGVILYAPAYTYYKFVVT